MGGLLRAAGDGFVHLGVYVLADGVEREAGVEGVHCSSAGRAEYAGSEPSTRCVWCWKSTRAEAIQTKLPPTRPPPLPCAGRVAQYSVALASADWPAALLSMPLTSVIPLCSAQCVRVAGRVTV